MEFNQNQQITGVELASILGIESSGITRLFKNGVLIKAKSKKFALKRNVTAYIEYLKVNAAGGGDLADNRNRLTIAQAEAQEIKNQVAKKELAPLSLLESALMRWAESTASIFESIPIKLKRKHPDLTARKLTEIKKELAKARNEMAKVQVDWSDND